MLWIWPFFIEGREVGCCRARKDPSDAITEKIRMCLGEQEVSFTFSLFSVSVGGNITSLEAGAIFSLVKSGTVLRLLKDCVF